MQPSCALPVAVSHPITRPAPAAPGFSFPGKAVAGGRLPKKRARRIKGHSDILGPTPERLRHGPVERLDKQIPGMDGGVGRPFRAIDTLAAMERRGSITPEMRQAGERFREEFRIAQLDPLRARALVQSSRSSGSVEIPGMKIEAAREHVWRAICAIGGLASAAGACLWHVVGWERSLKEWALQQGWAGRRVSQESASGILIAALSTLEAHYNGPRN